MDSAGASASLRSDRNFVYFWSSVAVSRLGSEITLLALPLFAVLTLNQGSGTVGLLTAAEYLPWLLLTLPAGVLVDRWPRRPVLVGCDLVRAVALGAVPVLAWRDALTVPVLLGLVFVAGCATVFFDVGSGTYLPEIIARDRIGGANAALETAGAVALVAGPALGGALVALIGAARAITLDAVSFVLSAVLLARTRRRGPSDGVREQAAGAQDRPPSWWREMTAGVQLVRRDPVLAPLAAYSGLFNLVGNAMMPVLLVFLVRDAALGPATLGLVLGIGATGALIGGALSARLSRRVGIGRAIAGTAVVVAMGEVLTALTPAAPIAAVWSAAVLVGMWAASTAYNANVATVRQSLTPQHLLGRVTAAYRFLAFGPIPLGAAAGGLLGELIGRRETMVGCAILLVVISLLPCTREVRRLREPLTPRVGLEAGPDGGPRLSAHL